MKTLYIVRHAKSDWGHEGLTDFERPLNSRGQSDAPRMGAILKDFQAAPKLIRASAANRAITTARLLASALDYPLESIQVDSGMYGAGLQEIVSIIRNLPEDAHEVMLVGHNPTMQMTAQALGGFHGENLPTCGIFCIDFAVDNWGEAAASQGTIRYFEYPKKHR
ncbi:MAG: histidine phosphatase family protein [Bacteroidota bacterium]